MKVGNWDPNFVPKAQFYSLLSTMIFFNVIGIYVVFVSFIRDKRKANLKCRMQVLLDVVLELACIVVIVQQPIRVRRLDHLHENRGQLALQCQQPSGKCRRRHLDSALVGRVDFEVVAVGGVQAEEAQALGVLGRVFAVGASNAGIQGAEQLAQCFGLENA
jgi:hypothetical protein